MSAFSTVKELQVSCQLSDGYLGVQFAAGVVLYDRESIVPFGERLFAVPISVLIPEVCDLWRVGVS
jgi:hypothetical protein